MPAFKNKTEYEKWKAERAKTAMQGKVSPPATIPAVTKKKPMDRWLKGYLIALGLFAVSLILFSIYAPQSSSDKAPVKRTLYKGEYYTNSRMLYATVSEDDFDFLLKIKEDEEAKVEMLLAGRLVPFAPGTRFQVTDKDTDKGYVKIRPEGTIMQLYTHRLFLE